MVKVEDQTDSPVPNAAPEVSTRPPIRMFIYFSVAVILALGFQKAIPALDVAMSCHSKTICSAVFVSNRSVDSIDIGVECNPLVKYLTTSSIDFNTKEVTSLTMGMLKQKAKFNGPYRGCSLVGKEPMGAEPLRTRKQLSDPTLPWPNGNAVDLSSDEEQSELAVTIDVAFERFKPRAKASNTDGSTSDASEASKALEWATREFVVVQNGKIVYEYYAPGFTPKTALLGWSMSKTLMATLIGIRVGEGAMDVHDKVSRWFPEWKNHKNRSQITLDHLLTMQTGLQWAEGYTLMHGEVIPMLFNDESCSERMLKAEPVLPAGKHFSYTSGTSNLLSEVLRASLQYDEAYWTYPARALFEKIGADSLVLETDRKGTFNAAAFGYGNARDWARIGLLFLRDGIWIDGNKILPEGWVKYVTTPRKSSHGIYGAHFWLGGTQMDPEKIDYDPHLQEHALASVLLSNTTYTMTGFGGQFVSVIPEKNAIIVRLAKDPVRRSYGELISEIVKVLP